MQNNPIEFLKEAAIMHAIDHEHIVRLYGVVLDTNALMLVSILSLAFVVLIYSFSYTINYTEKLFSVYSFVYKTIK